jgi:hypothetical protein
LLTLGALQRLRGLRVNGLDIEADTWNGLLPRDAYYVDQEITLGEDKLDQLLRWLKDQGM